MANAAVFPDPVLARISTSLPSNNKGIAVSWIRVGCGHPNWDIAYKNYRIENLSYSMFFRKTNL